MNNEEIVDKIIHWLLIYYDLNKSLPLRNILGEVQLKTTHLILMQTHGCISDAAKVMQESRTTVSERLRLKGVYSDDELRALCEKHSVEFKPRRWEKGWMSKEKIYQLISENPNLNVLKRKTGE